MDTLVFDIETSNFFTDPEVGRDNFSALRISAVGVYSYMQDRYFCFEESEMEKVVELFGQARRLVGFSMNRYDIPVLNFYFQRLAPTRPESGRGRKVEGLDIPAPNLWEMERVDLLEEIEMVARQRVSLSRLAEENLGVKKAHHGSEAIRLYREGRIEELKAYCLNDVKLTKELYDIYRRERSFLIPDKKTGEIKRVQFAKPDSETSKATLPLAWR